MMGSTSGQGGYLSPSTDQPRQSPPSSPYWKHLFPLKALPGTGSHLQDWSLLWKHLFPGRFRNLGLAYIFMQVLHLGSN